MRLPFLPAWCQSRRVAGDAYNRIIVRQIDDIRPTPTAAATGLTLASSIWSHDMDMNRRQFLETSTASAAVAATGLRSLVAAPPNHRVPELEDAIGIVSASAHAQLTGKAKGRTFSLLELPRILRDELDLRVLDLNTTSFPDFSTVDRSYLDKLRDVVTDAGCIMTNLKMNQRGIDINSDDRDVRSKAIAEYKRSIDVASQLGCRWARPLPGREKPDMAIHVASFRELCDYAAERNVKLLVENFGWMQSDADAVPRLVKAIGSNVAAGVDTGNWNGNDVRYPGLTKAFPLAATCDFKARRFGLNGEHPEYDLRRCFDIAWSSGFRGPWALEHSNPDTNELIQGFSRMRDMLRKWTAESRAD